MKKLVKSVLMLSIASMAILSSCKKDDANAEVTDVKVGISADPANPLRNSIVTITVTATGNVDNKLKSISVTRNDGKILVSKSLSGTTATETITDTLGSASSYVYTAALTGEKGSPATQTLTITTRQAAAQIDVSNPIPLFGQLNGQGTNQNFIQLVDPFANFATDVFENNKSKIDLCFYYGNSNKATLSSPTDAVMQGLYSGLTWTGVNTTGVVKTALTAAQFDVIAASNSDSVITLMAGVVTSWANTANLLDAGTVLMYKRADAKVGLIKVVSLENSDADGNPISAVNALMYVTVAAQKP